MLFGDPQLALTAVHRVLDVTADEVKAAARAQLRPDNRAVLVYEPVEPAEAAEEADAAATDTDAHEGADK